MFKILVLASNPQDTERLNLNQEIRAIEDALRTGEKRERFTVIPKVAVRISDLQSFLRREKPRIVHFSGHGYNNQGLILTTESGTQEKVGTEGLADLFRLFATKVECVVLNACYSVVQGEAINQYINYVVSTKEEILDQDAIAFSKGFYGALGDGETIERAYEFGCNRIKLEREKSKLEEEEVLNLLRKEQLKEIQDDIPDHKLSSSNPDSDSVSKGINILADLMDLLEVKTAVIKFRAEFQAISEQVEMLATYKDLHDLLHHLEFECYQGILREARNFPDDYTCLSILESYGQNLEDIIADVEGIIAQNNPASEGITWHQELKQAYNYLETALEEEDKNQLKKAIWFINRIIASQPSQINTALVSTAKVLRLPTLVEGMKDIWKIIANSALEPAKLDQFQESVISLTKLDEDLKILVATHDNWQKIDSQLRRIDTVTANSSDLFELEMSWEDLKAEVAEKCQDSHESWAISLQKEAARLDRALTAQNTPKVKQYFSSYRNRASQAFYKIDRELRTFCGNLRDVGNPLAYLLRMLE